MNNDWDFNFAAKASYCQLHSHVAKKMRTTKSVPWVNPLLKAFGKTPPVATTRRVPDGTRVYCVGDIHGRDDLLRDMAERVEKDMEARSFEHAVTVFLGDYVDRGPRLDARGRATFAERVADLHYRLGG